ncbi:unnamed protein product [Rhizoctonia solani]|uniref:Uncharacterized protein n=1 Tax=Rhizoctonia solani TaxID=456999 RepID=A0A8H3C5Q6_9AGAM|nr:unnamed protein product [Rhizoctonia solani]
MSRVETNESADYVSTTINYSLPNPMGTPLYAIQPYPNSASFRTNYIVDSRKIFVHNLRGREHAFSLDQNGFQFLVHHTNETFVDTESIRKNYFPEVQELLMKETGAHRALIVGHTMRHGRDRDLSTTTSTSDVIIRPPAHCVHADRTPQAVAVEVVEHLGPEGENLLRGRVRFIVVWRPIGQVYSEPLAVADSQSSSMTDLLPVRLKTSSNSTEALLARFNEKHKWYYLKNQMPHEVILIKGFDNYAEDSARMCLHSAFQDPGSEPDAPRRSSIEVKAIVFG